MSRLNECPYGLVHSIHLNSRHFGVNNRRCTTKQSTECLGYISDHAALIVLSVRGYTLDAGHKANARGVDHSTSKLCGLPADIARARLFQFNVSYVKKNPGFQRQKCPCLGELIPECKFQLFKRGATSPWGCILVNK